MGSTGVNSLITKINNTRFIQSVSNIGVERYMLTIPGVGKGGTYLSNSAWNVVIAKEVGGKLELVDLPSGNGLDRANTRTEAENLVRDWLKAIVNGQV